MPDRTESSWTWMTGSSQAEHDQRLHTVLACLQDWGFRLRLAKCSFKTTSVKTLGLLVGKDGIRADPRNVKAAQDLRRPGSVSEVRSLLGLANYYGKFVNRLRRYKAVFETVWEDTPFA